METGAGEFGAGQADSIHCTGRRQYVGFANDTNACLADLNVTSLVENVRFATICKADVGASFFSSRVHAKSCHVAASLVTWSAQIDDNA